MPRFPHLEEELNRWAETCQRSNPTMQPPVSTTEMQAKVPPEPKYSIGCAVSGYEPTHHALPLNQALTLAHKHGASDWKATPNPEFPKHETRHLSWRTVLGSATSRPATPGSQTLSSDMAWSGWASQAKT